MVNPKRTGTDRSYLQFDVSEYEGENISDAELSIAVYFAANTTLGSKIEAWHCPDLVFNETTITWNTQPFDEEVCSLIDTHTVVVKVIAGIPEDWHTWDVTAALQNESAVVDGQMMLVLKSAVEGEINDNSLYVQYLTQEYEDAGYRPMLSVS
jgi:hypothetical protein